MHVRIKPVNHCNHGCWFCACRANQLQLGDDMDLTDRLPESKMFEIVDDLIAMADAFAHHGTWVRVPMDALDDASYAVSRGSKSVSFRVSSTTCEPWRIAARCGLMKDVGVDHVKIGTAVVSNDAIENNAYHHAIMARATDRIGRAQALGGVGFDVINHYHETEERFQKDYDICPFAFYLTVIGGNARVYVCQDKAYNEAGPLGSIADRSFKAFWFSDENRARLYGLDPSRECRHHCVAHVKNQVITEVLAIGDLHGAFV